MDVNKKELKEQEIRTLFITPALHKKGWEVCKNMREEYYFTDGRVLVVGSQHSVAEGKKADYLLYHNGKPIAVVEAKDNKHAVGAEGCEEGFKTKETWFYRLDMPDGYKHFSKTKPMKVEHTQPIQDWWNDRKEIVGEEFGDKSRVFTAQQLLDLDCNFDQCKFPKEEEEILPPAELLKQYFEKRAALDPEIDKTLAAIQKILGIDIKSVN